MIAVLASRHDDGSRAAIDEWRGGQEVALLTIDDLLQTGWSVNTGEIERSTLVVGGQAVSVDALRCVINLLPGIHDFELLAIRKRDRQYVGSELFAFLVWWLNALPCPVLNRPSSGCLNGPAWNTAQWARACARSDIPGVASRLESRGLEPGSLPSTGATSTIVVGGRVHGDLFANECRTLARLAEVPFLEVFFRRGESGWRFAGVNLLPRIRHPEIRLMLEQCIAADSIEGQYGTRLGTRRGLANRQGP